MAKNSGFFRGGWGVGKDDSKIQKTCKTVKLYAIYLIPKLSKIVSDQLIFEFLDVSQPFI